MNAATLLTAKGLILALGGSLTLSASPASAPATSTTSFLKVDLGATAIYPLGGTYVNPPTGAVTLGNVPFTMANISLLTSGTKLDLPAVASRPSSVSVLVNSAYGFSELSGQTVGKLHLTFSDGTAQDTDIVGGTLVREWWLGPGYLTSLTGSASQNVWQGQGQPATGIGTATAVIDMLTATVKPTSASLASVSVQNNAGAPFDLMVSGLTVAYSVPVATGGNGGKNGGQDKNDNKNNQDNRDVNDVNRPTVKPGKGDSEQADKKPAAPKTPKKATIGHRTDHEASGTAGNRSDG
ncbi:MAG TPA: hypothetical protein VGD57_00195 [Candidatus Dormibacteraeota bacterium]|jgi:hypothetical protein